MAQSQDNEDLPALRSLQADNASYIIFINRSKSPVDLVWRDYRGKCVRYLKGFSPGQRFSMNTFETHPWQAWSSRSFEPVLVGGSSTFYPKPWRGEQQRTVVYVDEPVRPLLKLCLLRISLLIETDKADELEIPRTLCDELKRKKTVEVQEHSRTSQSWGLITSWTNKMQAEDYPPTRLKAKRPEQAMLHHTREQPNLGDENVDATPWANRIEQSSSDSLQSSLAKLHRMLQLNEGDMLDRYHI